MTRNTSYYDRLGVYLALTVAVALYMAYAVATYYIRLHEGPTIPTSPVEALLRLNTAIFAAIAETFIIIVVSSLTLYYSATFLKTVSGTSLLVHVVVILILFITIMAFIVFENHLIIYSMVNGGNALSAEQVIAAEQLSGYAVGAAATIYKIIMVEYVVLLLHYISEAIDTMMKMKTVRNAAKKHG